MPINFNNPTLLQLRTDYAASLREGQVALAQWLDPDVVGTLTGTPTGAFRLQSSTSALTRFNGTSWAAQAINGINFDGSNVSIGGASVGGRLGLIGTDQLLRLANDAAYVAFHNSANTTRSGYLQLHASNTSRLMVEAGQALVLGTSATDRVVVEAGGHLRPAANNAYTLGTTGERWSTVNTVALNASGAVTVGSVSSSGVVSGSALTASGAVTGASLRATAQPGFAARRSGNQTSGGTLVFNTEDVDNGASYNHSTGVFTAPISGMYAVALHVRVGTSGSQTTRALWFYKNGSLSRVWEDGFVVPSGGAGAVAFYAELYFAAGETLDVRTGVETFSATVWLEAESTFSARLVS